MSLEAASSHHHHAVTQLGMEPLLVQLQEDVLEVAREVHPNRCSCLSHRRREGD